MIKASHDNADYFTEYIYSVYRTEENNEFDVLVEFQCNDKTKDGLHCESCYTRALYKKLYYNRSFIKLKKFLSYQLGLYEDPQKWVKEFRLWIKYDKGVNLNYQRESLINEVLEEILEIDNPQADLSSFINITNIFEGATIHQLNMGNGNQINNYKTILDQMLDDGVSKDIIDEGAELLPDAEKSDSLKKIAGNWIKSLPFKIMEKSGEWALKNTDKIAGYQDSLMQWIANL